MSKICSISLILLSLCLSTTSNAAPVTITNASFETNVLADDTFVFAANGWTITPPAASAGTFNPSAVRLPVVPEGQNTLFINNGIVSQILTTNLVANTIYTLNVDVCDRTDTAFPGYLIELLAGATVISSDVNTVSPVNGCLPTTLSFTSTATDPDIGNALQLRFSSSGAQINFDNVRLDATPVAIASVPTLSEWMLGLLIMALMLISLRFHRASL